MCEPLERATGVLRTHRPIWSRSLLISPAPCSGSAGERLNRGAAMPKWPAAKLSDGVIGVDHHAAARNLQKLGVSLFGAQQFLKGEAVLSRNDRLVLSRIVLQWLGDGARPLDAIAQLRIRWGVSFSGASQFVAAEIV